MARQLRKLSTSIDKLFPSKEFTIGDDNITLRPLCLAQWIALFGKLNVIIQKCDEKGITLENYKEKEKAFQLFQIIIIDFPEFIEEVTGIERASLEELPPDILIGLIVAVIEINLASEDEFQKNFNSLTKLIPGTQKKVPETQTTSAE